MRDYVVQLVKDVGRAIDYLETRSDIQSEKVAYYGFSWGARMGAIVPAVENRLKVTCWWWVDSLPEADLSPKLTSLTTRRG